MNLSEALAGTVAPQALKERLVLLDLKYVDLGGLLQTGQMVVHETLVDEVTQIFAGIAEIGFPIEKMVPIVIYGWDDDASMAANNSSSFCFRAIAGTGLLSAHSKGAAIDINPVFNPFDGPAPEGMPANAVTLMPPGAAYDLDRPGTFSRTPGTLGNEVIELFNAFGWFWLGDRADRNERATRLLEGRRVGTDRHHFERIGYRDAVA